jgi:hypothetical protein
MTDYARSGLQGRVFGRGFDSHRLHFYKKGKSAGLFPFLIQKYYNAVRSGYLFATEKYSSKGYCS